MTTIRNLSFILVIAIFFAGCGSDGDREVAPPPEDVEQELTQFKLVRMLKGKTKWKLNAETATFLESDMVRVGTVELLIFGDNEGEVMTILGDEGEVNQRTNDIKITGNVKGVHSDGGSLTTEEIYWSDRKGKLYTLPGIVVTINYEDSVIVGEELEADPELETATLKNTTGVTRSEEKQSENPED